MTEFLPFYDYLLVRPDDSAKMIGKVHVPTQAQKKLTQGVVLAHGEGVYNTEGVLIPLKVEVGMTVMYGKYNGIEVMVNDEELMVLREDELFGMLIENKDTH